MPLASGLRRVRRGTQQPAPALSFPPLTAAERRLRETQLATNYSGDTPPHQHGIGPPTTASIVRASELQKRSLFRARHLSALGTCRQGSGAISYQSLSPVLTNPYSYKTAFSRSCFTASKTCDWSVLTKLSIRVGGVWCALLYWAQI